MHSLFPAESIPNLMQLVLTNNRLKNLAVRLTILYMTFCWLVIAQHCEAIYRRFPESYSLHRESCLLEESKLF